MVNYNHLVANLVILHNVNAMTKVIKQLKKKALKLLTTCWRVSRLTDGITSNYWGNTPCESIGADLDGPLNWISGVEIRTINGPSRGQVAALT
jgi:hypothetical protein